MGATDKQTAGRRFALKELTNTFASLTTTGVTSKTNSAPEGSPAKKTVTRRAPRPLRQNSAPGCERQDSAPDCAEEQLALRRQDCLPATAGGRRSPVRARPTAGRLRRRLPLGSPISQVRRDSLAQENALLQHEVAALTAQLGSSHSGAEESEVLRRQLEELTKQCTKLKEKGAIRRRDNDSLLRTVHDANTELSTLKTKCRTLGQDNKMQKALFKMACRNLETLKSDFDVAKRNAADAAATLQLQLEEARAEAERRVNDAENQCNTAHLCDEHARLQEAHKELQSSAAAEMARMQEEIESLQKGKMDLVLQTSTEMERLRDEIRVLGAQRHPGPTPRVAEAMRWRGAKGHRRSFGMVNASVLQA